MAHLPALHLQRGYAGAAQQQVGCDRLWKGQRESIRSIFHAAACTYSGATSSPPSSCPCSRACSTAGHTGHRRMAAYGTIMVLALSCAPYPAMLLLLLLQMPRRAGNEALQPAGPTKPSSPLSHAHCSHVTMSHLPAAGAVPWKAHARVASCHAQPHMQCWIQLAHPMPCSTTVAITSVSHSKVNTLSEPYPTAPATPAAVHRQEKIELSSLLAAFNRLKTQQLHYTHMPSHTPVPPPPLTTTTTLSATLPALV